MLINNSNVWRALILY